MNGTRTLENVLETFGAVYKRLKTVSNVEKPSTAQITLTDVIKNLTVRYTHTVRPRFLIPQARSSTWLYMLLP